MSYEALVWFWRAALIPAIALAVVAIVKRRDVQHEDWTLAVVFFISWISMYVEKQMAAAGLATWIVYALYPVPQVAFLAWGFGARWPSIRSKFVLLSVCPVAVATLSIVVTEWWQKALPAKPEMGSLAVASVIALSITAVRPDMGRLRQAVIIMTFGATLPATIVMGRAFDTGRLDQALWYWKVCFTVGAVLAAVSIWYGAVKQEKPKPTPVTPLEALGRV